jgi:hypothetical protein
VGQIGDRICFHSLYFVQNYVKTYPVPNASPILYMVKWMIVITIRTERRKDIGAIHWVNRQTLGRDGEAVLVQKILESRDFMPKLSLVAAK